MLTTYRITTTSGHHWTTCMAAHVTLAIAEAYFLGRYFDVAAYPAERLERAVEVERLPDTD